MNTGDSLSRRKLPKLTKKEAEFVRLYKSDPKMSGTAAALMVYGKPDKPVTYSTASSIATENLKKPRIISHLENYNDLVENTIANTIQQYSDSDDIRERTLAVDTAKYVHDKVHGKATQKVITGNVELSLEDAIALLR